MRLVNRGHLVSCSTPTPLKTHIKWDKYLGDIEEAASALFDSPPSDKTAYKPPASVIKNPTVPGVKDVGKSNNSSQSSDQGSGGTHAKNMIDISEDEELRSVLQTEAEDVQDKSGTSSRGKGWPSAGFDKRTTKQRGTSDDLIGPKKVGKNDKKQKR